MPARVSPGSEPAAAELVILLHGVAMPACVLHRLARRLAAAGFRVVNHDYPWRALTLEQIAREHLPAGLRAAGAAEAPRVHFVGHSLGALIVRLHLAERRPPNLGRVVLLGPPNAGSAVADRLDRSRLCRRLVGPNLPRLGTATPGAVAPRLPAPDYEAGVIAGARSINPVFARWLERPNDGAVSVASARLAGARDFLVVPHSHTVMLWRAAVAAQVIAFLRTGRFNPAPAGGAG